MGCKYRGWQLYMTCTATFSVKEDACLLHQVRMIDPEATQSRKTTPWKPLGCLVLALFEEVRNTSQLKKVAMNVPSIKWPSNLKTQSQLKHPQWHPIPPN